MVSGLFQVVSGLFLSFVLVVESCQGCLSCSCCLGFNYVVLGYFK